MIQVDKIKDEALEILINKFDESINYLRTQFNIELKTYGNFLRIILNNIQPETFNHLIEQIKVNRELEKALDNSGGYTLDFLGDNNPKECLLEIIRLLQITPLKFNQLIGFVNKDNNRKSIIADINDIDCLTLRFRKRGFKIISHAELKKNLNENKNLVFYSFNGKKDFDFIYNLNNPVSLVLFSQENQLYQNQLQKRKQQIENEVGSDDRKLICDIQYELVPDLPINLSQTIESIVNRIDSFGNKAYENYKEETDTLLEEIEEKIIYKITFSNIPPECLESNETVFTCNGDLIKVYRINVSDSIRIYPREQLAEDLYQVAVETDEETFGKVGKHSDAWQKVLAELKQIYEDDLYSRLKEKGIGVLPATVESYLSGHRKFPMANRELKAIYKLKFPDLNETEIDSLLAPIRKSKSTYNSTMIALGRGIKQEMKLFLKEKRIGEILARLKFTTDTLQSFVTKYMPLAAITKKEAFQDENRQLEFHFIQQLEL